MARAFGARDFFKGARGAQKRARLRAGEKRTQKARAVPDKK